MPSSDRNKQGILTGIVGIVCNLLLGGAKLAAGLLSGSVSIVSDAANNLADAGSSVLTVTSFALGNRAADKGHPFGHGRYEYIASFLIGVIIVFVGVELAASSIEKIVRPEAVSYGTLALVILSVSIAAKLGMGAFYAMRAKTLGSDTLKAAAFDSFSDCIVTGGLLLSVVLSFYIDYPLEGVVGLIISAVIVFGGIKLVKETINRLLGGGCDPETGKKLSELVMQGDLVVGTHDLRVHDYGPNCKIASIHAEFDRNVSITEAHDVIDKLEHRALGELGVELVIHVDPIDGSDLVLNRLRHAIKDVVRLYAGVGMHDLEVDYNARKVELHLVVPEAMKQLPRLKELIEGAAVGVLGEGYTVSVVVDVAAD